MTGYKETATRYLLKISVLAIPILIGCTKDTIEASVDLIFSPPKGGEGELIKIFGFKSTEGTRQSLRVSIGNDPTFIEYVDDDEIHVRLSQVLQDCGDVQATISTTNSSKQYDSKFTIACPEIDNIYPLSADIGDTLVITGKYFTSTSSRILVSIGTYGSTEIISSTQTAIQAKIKSGYSGNNLVSVKIGNKVDMSEKYFILNGPVITSVSPDVTNGCQLITIQGSGFSSVPDENRVWLGHKDGLVLSATESSLVVRPPYDMEEIVNKSVYVLVFRDQKVTISKDPIEITDDAWKQIVPLDDVGRNSGVGFSIGTKGYTGTGTTIIQGTRVLLNDFWEYDSGGDTWSRKESFPGVARMNATGFSIGTNGYVGLGRDNSGNALNDFWEYNPSSNSWIQLADFPGTARDMAIGFSLDGKGYVGAGSGIGETRDIWELDPITKGWTKKTDYPGIAIIELIRFTIGNRAYIGSGFLAADFWEYDAAGNNWSRLNNLPFENYGAGVSLSYNGNGIVATGAFGVYPTDQYGLVWKYNPDSDRWSRLSNFIDNYRTRAVGFTIPSGFIIGTGVSPTNVFGSSYVELNDFFRFNCE